MKTLPIFICSPSLAFEMVGTCQNVANRGFSGKSSETLLLFRKVTFAPGSPCRPDSPSIPEGP